MVCAVCNVKPGEETQDTFPDRSEQIGFELCQECFNDFSESESVELQLLELAAET
jgi:hypothetical protein